MEHIDLTKQQKLLEIVRKHREHLMRFPGVHQVDVGYKYVKGSYSGEFAIRVHVYKKKKPNELKPDDLIPCELEGIPVDVIEMNPKPLINRRWTESGKWHNFRYEPVVGGVGIEASPGGTLGAIVFDASSLAPLALTNEHVVGNNIGKDVFQTTKGDMNTLIGQVLRTDSYLDCAVIELDDVRTYSRRIIDTPEGLMGIADPLVGMRVHKSGAASATTFGIVDGVSEDELTVIPDNERPVTRYQVEGNIVVSGDSGSVWVESKTGFAVGLLWGVSVSTTVVGYAKKMSKVADVLSFVVEPANGAIAAVSTETNSIDLFCRNRVVGGDPANHVVGDEQGLMRHRKWYGDWQPWQTIDVTLTSGQTFLDSGPAASSWGDNRLDFFCRGMDGQLHHLWKTTGNWQSGTVLGGVLSSSPAAVSWGSNRIDVFARGGDSALYQKYWDGSWHGWHYLAGELTSAPAVSTWGLGRLDVFARGRDNALWHKWWQDSWSGWESLGGTLTSSPAAVSWGHNRIDVFALETDRALYHKFWNGSWHQWERLGGNWICAPACCSWGEGRLDVFLGRADQAVWHMWYDGEWHNPELLGGFIEADKYIAP